MTLTLLLLVTGALAMRASYWVIRFQQTGRQVNNMERGRACVGDIEAFREAHGVYPARIELAVPQQHRNDEWNRPFAYQTNGKAFVLISFGRDGRVDPEAYDPWRARSSALTTHQAPQYVWNICGRPDADQIMSDLGEHRICGK